MTDRVAYWVVTGVAIVAFIGALTFSSYLRHLQKLECMSLRGDWSGGSCTFHKAEGR